MEIHAQRGTFVEQSDNLIVNEESHKNQVYSCIIKGAGFLQLPKQRWIGSWQEYIPQCESKSHTTIFRIQGTSIEHNKLQKRTESENHQ